MSVNRRWSALLWATGLLVLVYVAGISAVYFAPSSSEVATWWPAAGVSVALLVLSPRSWWPALTAGVVLSSGLANLSAGRTVELSLLFGMANAAEAVVASAFLRRRPGKPRLESPDDFFRLVAACVLGAATVGVGIALSVAATGGDGLDAGLTVTPSHLASTLVIVPLALVWHERATAPQRAELVLQSLLLTGATVLVFGPEQPLSLAFLPLPLLVWAGLRFGTPVVSGQLLAVGILTTLLTARGGGPFAVGARADSIDPAVAGALVQTYLVCAALMSLPLAIAVSQRALLLSRLTQERELTNITLDTTNTIIIVSDLDGTVVRANPATYRLTGFLEAQIVGHPLWEGFTLPERADVVREMFAGGDGSGIPGSRETDIATAGGDRLRIVWNNDLVRDANGSPRFAVMTGVDVTGERTTSGMIRHLLESAIATALVGLDEQGKITLFSRGAQQILGRDADEVMGHLISDFIDPDQLEQWTRRQGAETAFEALVQDVDRGGAPQTRDWTWVRGDGTPVAVSTTISVVENVVGKRIGYLCVGRDVTEQRRSQEMLVAALEKERQGVERLRQLDAAKNEFVSTVSHELRTPTTSIVGYTEMLRDGSAGEANADQLPLLDAIARNGERLIGIASDLLTLAGLESGQAIWERGAVDLTQLVASGEEAMRPMLASRHLTVDFRVPDEAVTVIGDAGHLDRVLMNLLSNAVKFTEDDGHITCTLEVDDGEARLTVADDGIGIPEEEQGELFSKFFRSSTAQDRAIQGTGLGLSIISSIVAAHGGRIDIRSAHLEGTTVTVRLPLMRHPSRQEFTTG